METIIHTKCYHLFAWLPNQNRISALIGYSYGTELALSMAESVSDGLPGGHLERKSLGPEANYEKDVSTTLLHSKSPRHRRHRFGFHRHPGPRGQIPLRNI